MFQEKHINLFGLTWLTRHDNFNPFRPDNLIDISVKEMIADLDLAFGGLRGF